MVTGKVLGDVGKTFKNNTANCIILKILLSICLQNVIFLAPLYSSNYRYRNES
jgi:hypothetical protein